MKENKKSSKSGRNTNVTHQPGLKICFTSFFSTLTFVAMQERRRRNVEKCVEMKEKEKRRRRPIRQGNVIMAQRLYGFRLHRDDDEPRRVILHVQRLASAGCTGNSDGEPSKNRGITLQRERDYVIDRRQLIPQ